MNTGDIEAEPVAWNGRAASVRLRVPPLGALILRREEVYSEPEDDGGTDTAETGEKEAGLKESEAEK